MDTNRRHDPRLPVEWEVPVSIRAWPRGRTLARDVSASGIGMTLPVSVKPGDQIVFWCNSQRVRAEVVRVTGSTGTPVGLRWLDPPPRALREFIPGSASAATRGRAD